VHHDEKGDRHRFAKSLSTNCGVDRRRRDGGNYPGRKSVCAAGARRARQKTKLVKPDIMAQLKATWGDRIFSAKEVAEMRAAELEGEEG
jgi:hypothetical protein